MPITEPRADAPFFIVLNAGSGRSETEVRRSTIEGIMASAGRACTLEMVEVPTELPATAQRMAERATAEGGILVAAGGDGTINTVAHQAVLAGCPFGVLPQGTYNYFGRTHGIPEDLDEAVYALLRATMRPVQVGLLNNKIFLVNASVGLYPRMLEEREQDKRHYGRTRIISLLSAIKIALRPHRHLRITLEFDGKERQLRTTTLFVGNNRLQLEQVGMRDGLIEAVEDGQLVGIAPRPMGKLGLLRLLLRGMLGRLGDDEEVEAFAFRRLLVRTPSVYGRKRMKVAIDGEVERMAMPLEFRVLEGRLLLMVQGASRTQPRTAPDETAVA